MTDAEAEALVRRWFEELFTDGDLGTADEILAADVRYHGPESLSPTDVTTPEDIKRYVEVYGRAFPDLQYTVEDVFGEGGQVCARWTATGTHRSDLFGIEPTGEVFVEEGVNVFTVREGEIAEVWSDWDTLKMVQELEIVPPIGLELG